ncbi:hypothetical protein [Paenibacillus glacialis]|uniref:Squalene cyclase C-terminal domain-containing protein n=1 Tax=Paenibacillus glacialis TaxID=494026 RepID=A0A168KTW3_9BACL|nr:hypothetical protein [Paenibacillus glacialis]OAB42457.1 hypothetical protein PGLA_12360 [Paenibacillus glacialis]
MLTSEQSELARTFIYSNARLLDRKRYEFHFEGGTVESVLRTLRMYQNPDGGFGNALEPDIRTASSQPIPTEMALLIMDEIDAFDPDILEGIVSYLQQITIPTTGGAPRAFCSLNADPHAPWWTTEEDHIASMNPTGSILGLLYKQSVITSFYKEPWFEQSVQFVWDNMTKIDTKDYHDLIQCITFLTNTPDRERATPMLLWLNEQLQQEGTIELDPEAGGYVHKVLDFAPSSSSYCRQWISSEIVTQHLIALANEQQEDGGWPIRWPALSPGNEAEWRGSITVDRLLTLRE